MKHKKTFLLVLLGFLLLLPTMAVAQIESVLHMAQPDYDFPYGIPDRDSVKATIDRVLGFLDTAMPQGTENGRLRTGELRQTSYESGIVYAACEDVSVRTGDQRYYRFAADRLQSMAALAPLLYDSIRVNRRYDKQMRMMIAPGALDDAGAMCSAYMRLMLMESGGKKVNVDKSQYRSVVKCYMNQIWRQYRIGSDRIFARIRPHFNTVWLDDMYMGIPPLAWYGALTSSGKSIHEAVGQIKAFKSRMWVEEEKLFRHGWVEEMEPHPFFPWGRANGWAILTMCEVLDAMNVYAKQTEKTYAEYEADRAFVLQLLRDHAEGLCRVQHKTGLWHQLLNDPSSYLETSATAIFTYCLAHAVCEGWLSSLSYGAQILLAWNALSLKVDSEGRVNGTCVGSGMGFDAAFYCYRPVHALAAHGYGPMLWAGGEIIRLLDTTHPRINDSAVHFYPNAIDTHGAAYFSEERK